MTVKQFLGFQPVSTDEKKQKQKKNLFFYFYISQELFREAIL